MTKTKKFAFRVDDEERQQITLLAYNLRMTQSDAIRLMIRLFSAQTNKSSSTGLLGHLRRITHLRGRDFSKQL